MLLFSMYIRCLSPVLSLCGSKKMLLSCKNGLILFSALFSPVYRVCLLCLTERQTNHATFVWQASHLTGSELLDGVNCKFFDTIHQTSYRTPTYVVDPAQFLVNYAFTIQTFSPGRISDCCHLEQALRFFASMWYSLVELFGGFPHFGGLDTRL
jgi:hypothetical protein